MLCTAWARWKPSMANTTHSGVAALRLNEKMGVRLHCAEPSALLAEAHCGETRSNTSFPFQKICSAQCQISNTPYMRCKLRRCKYIRLTFLEGVCQTHCSNPTARSEQRPRHTCVLAAFPARAKGMVARAAGHGMRTGSHLHIGGGTLALECFSIEHRTLFPGAASARLDIAAAASTVPLARWLGHANPTAANSVKRDSGPSRCVQRPSRWPANRP